ncbi:hypothetical protein [Methylorubrum extorquens]
MIRSDRMTRRTRINAIERQVRSNMRTSNVVLAVAGVALLGGFCLLLLAAQVRTDDEMRICAA